MPGFVAGFVLWATSSALVSGTFEAYAYASLDALGQAHRYPGFIGRAHAVTQLAVLVGIALGGPLFALGGYRLAGVVSTLVCVMTIPLALDLPPPPAPGQTASSTPSAPGSATWPRCAADWPRSATGRRFGARSSLRRSPSG